MRTQEQHGLYGLYAVKLPSRTVTFNANGGTVNSSSATTGDNGKLSALPTPTRSGYSFDGWYTAAEGGDKVSTDTVYTENTTLYAHWTQNSSSSHHSTTYTITVKDVENGSVSADRKTASKGTTVTVTPDEDYTLETITVMDSSGKTLELTAKGNGKYTFKMPASKVTVSAAFMPEKTVTELYRLLG